MEREVYERETTHPSSVEDLSFSNERPTKDSNVESKRVPKGIAVKKKLESKNVGPVRDYDAPPWNGITLNRCLVVAAVLALLSVGFQVLQDAVDTDDDLPDIEPGVWISNDTTEHLPEPWFFEGWFGISQTRAPDDPSLPELLVPEEDEESIEAIEETEEIAVEVIKEVTEEIENVEDIEETVQTEGTNIILDTEESNNSKEDKHKQTEKWGLKAKNKYMQTKASKIHRATGEESQKSALFPFMRKQKKSPKIPQEFKEKPLKEKSHKHKDKERRYEHPKKQEGGKPFKKGREESSKYFKHDKEKKGGKEIKGFKEHKQHKEYKKQLNGRHHS